MRPFYTKSGFFRVLTRFKTCVTASTHPFEVKQLGQVEEVGVVGRVVDELHLQGANNGKPVRTHKQSNKQPSTHKTQRERKSRHEETEQTRKNYSRGRGGGGRGFSDPAPTSQKTQAKEVEAGDVSRVQVEATHERTGRVEPSA